MAGESRHDEVGEELWYKNGAIVPPSHMESIPVEIAARSITATPRAEHISIVVDGPISGAYNESGSEEEGSLWEEDSSSCEDEGSNQREEEGSGGEEDASGQITAPQTDESPYCNTSALEKS